MAKISALICLETFVALESPGESRGHLGAHARGVAGVLEDVPVGEVDAEEGIDRAQIQIVAHAPPARRHSSSNRKGAVITVGPASKV
jgi:hypothetical protein